MKTAMLAIAMAITLAACTHAVSGKAWQKAEEVCASNGGVRWVESDTYVADGFHSELEVRCANDAMFEVQVDNRKAQQP
jgi:hypothetical protein